MTSAEVCLQNGHGFDGPMHPFGMHVDTYNGKCCDPFCYKGTDVFCDEIKAFVNVCLPIFKQHFHLEYVVMQRAMHSFGEISPSNLGGSIVFPCLSMYPIISQIHVIMTCLIWVLLSYYGY